MSDSYLSSFRCFIWARLVIFACLLVIPIVVVSQSTMASLIASKSPWGIYSPTFFSSNTLYEVRGNGRDATCSSVSYGSGSGNGASASIPYIYGGTTSTVLWPSGSIPSSFTICSITRYAGSSKMRILTSYANNWLHGHWFGNKAAAFYNGWKTGTSNTATTTNWLTMCGKNSGTTPNNVYADGAGVGTVTGGDGGGTYRMSINLSPYSSEISDWAFAYLIIWDQILTDAEIQVASSALVQYLSTGALTVIFPTSSPTRQPSSQPSRQPTRQPTGQPSQQPTNPTTQPTSQPSFQPTAQPSRRPSQQPTLQPTSYPTSQPSGRPSRQPTVQPSRQPSRQPVSQPSGQPSSQPASQPSGHPSRQPTAQPTSQPSASPTTLPTLQPTSHPSSQPSGRPSRQPTVQPSRQPSRQPVSQPSGQPSPQPTSQPSRRPSRQPTAQPTSQPSVSPTTQPSQRPSCQPSRQPTQQPTRLPSGQPSSRPSEQPSARPSGQPSRQPTCQPSADPTLQPSSMPTGQPSTMPTSQPSFQPSGTPSAQPSLQPSWQPTSQPSIFPSSCPTTRPTNQPTNQPSACPTTQPSMLPSTQPTSDPTGQPSCVPSSAPSIQPFSHPSVHPTNQPTSQPSSQPSDQPTCCPSNCPSSNPSSQPSRLPTSRPSSQPTSQPSIQPTRCPSSNPSTQPSAQPSVAPSGMPSTQPSSHPSQIPTSSPTMQPTMQPSNQPSSIPSASPSSQPSGKPLALPTGQPSHQPTSSPSMDPTSQPSTQPSSRPTAQPQGIPTSSPTSQPSLQPSRQPSRQPTRQPTSQPSDASAKLDHVSNDLSQQGGSMLSSLANTTRNVDIAKYSLNVTDSVAKLLLPYLTASLGKLNSTAAVLNSISFGANGIQISISVLSPKSTNGSAVALPGTSSGTSIMLGNLPAGALGLLASVMEISPSLLAGKNFSSGSSQSQPASGIVTIALSKVTANGTVEAVTLPSFDATLTLTSTPQHDTAVLRKNCTVGLTETVSLYCPLSHVWMNMTCTGKASASVSRKCPVTKLSCSVLNLEDNSVASDDFCSAIDVGSTVVCRCGYGPISSNGSQALLALQGRISVAAFSSFAAGEFDSSVSAVVVPLTGNIAQKSVLLFVTFTLLWGLGFVKVLVYFGKDTSLVVKYWPSKAKKAVSSGSVSAELADQDNRKELQSAPRSFTSSLQQYLITICPGMIVGEAWWRTLASYLLTKHIYFRVFKHWFEDQTSPNTVHRTGVSASRRAEKHIKKMIMEVVMALTSLTLSCFVLALLYDFQYPADDGYCQQQLTQATCEYRKSLIDPWHNRCEWRYPLTDADAGIAAVVIESRNGQTLQETVLRAETSSSGENGAETVTYCQLNANNNSLVAFLFSFIITSIFIGFTDFFLEHVFLVLNASVVKWGEGMPNRHSELPPLHLPDTVLSRREQWYHAFATKSSYVAARKVISTMDISPTREGLGVGRQSETREVAPSPMARSSSMPSTHRRRAGRTLLTTPTTATIASATPRTTASAASPLAVTPSLVLPSLSSLHRGISGAEYGVGLLHHLLAAVVRSFTQSPAKETVFLRAMHDFFEPVYYTYAWLQYAYYLLLLCINGGAFYFIISKTVVRGYSWQIAFFRGLMLEWISEIFVIEVLEIVLLDIWIPQLVYQDARTAAVMILQAASLDQLVQQDLTVSSTIRTTTNPAIANESESLSSLATEIVNLAQQRPELLESKVVRRCQSLLQLSSPSNSPQLSAPQSLGGKAIARCCRRWLVSAIAAIPHAVLRSIISVGCTLLVAGTVFTFFAASKQLQNDYDHFQQWQAIIAIGFVILFAGMIWVSVQRTKRRLRRDVLPMVPSDYNDADALDPDHDIVARGSVASSPWPMLQHESSRLLEEKANSASDNPDDGAHFEATHMLGRNGSAEDSDDDKSLMALSFSLSFSWSQSESSPPPSPSPSSNSSTSWSSLSLSKLQLSASSSSSVASDASPPSSRPLSPSRSPLRSRSCSHSSEQDAALSHLHRRARSNSYDSYSDNGDEAHHGDDVEDDSSFHLYY